jgi:hypothetical protein
MHITRKEEDDHREVLQRQVPGRDHLLRPRNIHITTIVNKANRTLGFLRRSLKTSDSGLKTTAYRAVVRPILEYACAVWDPYTSSNIKSVEKAGRRAVRWVLNVHLQQHQVSGEGWEARSEMGAQQTPTDLLGLPAGETEIRPTGHALQAPRPPRHHIHQAPHPLQDETSEAPTWLLTFEIS